VDSTNNYAMGIVHSGMVAHGNAYFALEQTEGKGRRGKGWKSTKGENITLSIVADTGFLMVQHQFNLIAAVSLGCVDFLRSFVKENIKIKWPNDLFYNDTKAGGILIENIIKGNAWQWAVIGIGLNVNQTDFSPDIASHSISLKQIKGVDYDVIELGKNLRDCVLKRIEALKQTNFEIILSQYIACLFRLNEKVKLKKKNIVFETTIKGVSSQGQLLTKDVMERSFDFDEIEWVL
jgi:BirA family biotin operon repressor/biotin-[acetyl-CoA-carboxylase] ligase